MHFVKSVVSFYYENNNLMMEQMDFKDLPQITNLEQDECYKPYPPPFPTEHHLCESNKGIPRNEMYHLCSDHNFVWFIRTNEALNGRLDINFRHFIHFSPSVVIC